MQNDRNLDFVSSQSINNSSTVVMSGASTKIVDNLRRLHTPAQVARIKKPDWPIDVVFCWCGLPESTTCGYSEDLRYSIRSVTQNMPWIRSIILVVQDDFEMPHWMALPKGKRVGIQLKIIKVRSFIPVRYLPTANYHVISSWIWRIRGLSERFIFMHDDMYVVRPTPWTCFFTDDKRAAPINRHHPGPADHGLHPDHRIPYVRMWTQAIQKYDIHNTRVQLQATPCRRAFLKKYYNKYRTEVNEASRMRVYDGYHDFNLLRFTTALTSTSGEAVLIKTDEYEWTALPPSPTPIDYFVESPDHAGIANIFKANPRFLIINNSGPAFSRVYDALRALFPKHSPFEARLNSTSKETRAS